MAGMKPIKNYPLPESNDLPANTAEWSIDIGKAVLLVHDMQRYFLAPFPTSLRKQIVNNCKYLCERCTESSIPIIYSAQSGDMTEQQRGLLSDIWGPGMRADPDDNRIIDELAPKTADVILTKWRYSAFHRSDLLERMREQNRTQIIICGVYAHVGVLVTAIDAFTNNIKPFLVADALGDFSEKHHLMALEYAACRCSFVVSRESVFQ
jgi:isochorismate hydrolase